MDLKDTSVLITGGSSGLGRATAKRLQHAGAKIAILDLNATAAASEQDLSENFLSIDCDVTDEAAVSNALDQIEAQQGTPRVVVNCAGIATAKRLVGRDGPLPLAEFQQTVAVNLSGTFNVMRLSAERMSLTDRIGKLGERGVIINTASIAATDGQIGQVAYAASKAGICGMTLPAAREMAQFGIRVMAIAPGVFATPMVDGMSEEVRASLAASIPFPKQLGEPSQFAALVEHIVENSMLNGEVIRLDGALRMGA